MDKERLEQLNNKFNMIRANGGIMPEAQGDDYNNEIINLIPSKNVNVYEVGRDEKENPIMSSDVVNALSKPTDQDEGKGFIENINSAISSPTSMENIRKYESMLDAEGELTTFREPKIDLSLEGFAKDTKQLAKSIAGSMDSFRASRLYANLFYGKDALQERIHKISKATGIGESVLASNDDVFQHGEKLLQQLEKYERIPSMLTTDGKLDMQKVYKEMPYLKLLQEKHGDVTAAMALANAKGLMAINDVYKSEFDRFAASVGYGLGRGRNNLQRQWTYGKAMIRGLRGRNGYLTYDEQKEIDRLNAENAETPDYSYSSFGSGLGAMIGGAAENLPMIFSSQGVGKLAGGVAGAATYAVTKNASAATKAYNWVSNAVGVAVMGLEIGGSQYEQNLYKLDKNGVLMYTPRQAAAISLLQGVSEGVLEQYSLNQIGRSIFGGKELIPIAELWKKAPELAATEGMKTVEDATRKFIADKIADAAKTHMVIFRNELQEEFTQQVSDMVIENMAQVVLKGDRAELSSVGEILTQSLGAAMQAVPSIMGFSLIGGVGLHPIVNAKSVLGARQRIARLMTDDLARSIHKNVHQLNTIDGVAKNLDNIAELNQKAPEVQREILDDMNRRFGMENTDVDIVTLNQMEGGEAVVNAIAEKAGITAEELQACAQGTGMLRVKTSVIQETVHDLQGNEEMVTELYKNLAKDETVLTSHKAEEAQKRARDIIKKLDDIRKKTHEQEINTIVAKDFNQNEEEAKEARSILEADYDNAEREYKRRLKRVNDDIRGIIAPVLKELKSGMRQGVDIIRVEGERDSHYEKQSNNAEWARNYFEDYGHWPNERELVDLAIKIASGRQDPRYGLMDYQNNTEETRKAFAEQAAVLDELVEKRDLLEGMQDRFEGMKAGDRAAQAMLSADGQEIYEQAKKEFAASQNKEVRAAAKEEALAYARYCDLMAQNYAEAYNRPFTAKDYLQMLRVNVNAVEGKAPVQNAAQLMQPMQKENKVYVRNSDGNVDWGYINNITADNGEIIKAAPLRVQIGFQVGLGNQAQAGVGYTHIAGKHPYIVEKYSSVENAINNILHNYDFVLKEYPNGREQLILGKSIGENKSELLILELCHDDGDYYSVIGIKPQRKKQTKEKKEKALSFNGSVTPLSASGDGALYTPTGIKAGTKGDLLARKDNVFPNISITEAGDYVKKYTYVEADKNNPSWKNFNFKALMQSAFHGTGALFDRFDTSFMGTGEGAQAHGWGLYFAKDKTVAEDYRNKLTQRRVLYKGREVDSTVIEFGGKQYELEGDQWYSDGQLVDDDTLLSRLQQINDADGNIAVVLRNAENRLALYENSPYENEIRDDVDFFKTNKDSINKKPGRLTEAAEYIKRNAKDENSNAIAAVINTLKQEIRIDDRIASGMMLDGTAETNREKFDSVMESKRRLQGILQTIEENKDDLKLERGGQVFEVDVPEDNVLLDEQKQFVDQPKKVQTAIRKLWKSIGYNTNALRVMAGQEIYKTLSSELGSPQKASLALNDVGVKGIAYDGRADGRCFVVFDDNAIFILNKFYQQMNGVKGSTSFSESSPLKVISLFKNADRSTFMHEMSHVYLLDLERLAASAPDSRFAKDYATVMAWAGWKRGMAEEYKGTSSYEEFKTREKNILEAQYQKDTETEEKLLKEWAQERFARGFEEYLRTGEAPAVGLEKAFLRFKKWLTNIYKQFIGAGVRATPEVEAVMARMLASEEEIQVMNEIRESNRLTGVDGLDMGATEVAAMYSRWQERAREQAEAQVLKELLKDYKTNVQDKLQEHEDALREEIRQMLLQEMIQQKDYTYAVDEAVIAGVPLNNALVLFGVSRKEYNARKKDFESRLEKAVNKQVKAEMEAFCRQMPDAQTLHDKAMQAIYSGDYQLRLAELERKILRGYKERYMEAPQILQKGLHGLDNAREQTKPELMKRKLAELKYSIRWNDAQWNLVKEMEDLLAPEIGENVSAEKLEAFDKKYNELKAATVQNKDWLRKVRGGTMEAVDFWKRSARFRLEEMTLRDATNYEHWIREGEKQAVIAGQEFSKAQKNKGKTAAKHVEQAEQAKQRQTAFVAMTSESIAMKKTVGQWIGRIRNRQKSMAAGKIKMDPNLRYFHDHVLWVYGLAAADARKPVTLGNRTFIKMMRELMTDELQLGEEELPPWLVAAADAVERDSKGYNGLTMSEFQDLMNFTTWLYTLSKNQTSLLTMDVSMEQVEGDCFKDWRETVHLGNGARKVSEIKKQLGRYMAMIVKPETWLNVLGGKEGAFVRYIYIPLLKAAEAEEIAQEKEARFLRGYDIKKADGTTKHVKGLYERFYTKEELRIIGSEKLTDEEGNTIQIYYGENHNELMELTKENILCMALNWGNRTNRSRLCKSLGLLDWQVQNMYLEKFLTEKDWDFVQAMWDHINVFGDPASAVLEKSTGLPMKRVEADQFTVRTEDGERTMKGGYYPIVKDVDKSLREVEFEKMEQAQSMGGASVFGVGMGSTKERSASNEIDDPLLLELLVAHSHIKGMIHIIHSRLAVRDAYKVLHNKQIAGMISSTLGQEAYKAMDEWVMANWHAPIQPTDLVRDLTEKVRSRTVGAIMAYRLSTALLNAANCVYMAQEIGIFNTARAVIDYYKDWRANDEFVRNASVYMRNRDTNMDRDLNAQAEELVKHHGKIRNKLNEVTGEKVDELSYFVGKYANWMIEKTDAIFSKPLYLWQYRQTYNAALESGKTAEEAGEEANLQAVRTVTHVFSSSRKVDSSSVQRTRDAYLKLLTPFFSFSNMMMNAVWSKWYEGRYQGRKVEARNNDGDVLHNEDGSVMYVTVERSFREKYAGFVKAIILNYFVGAFFETMLREGINAFTGSGDDDDYWTRVFKKMPKSIIDSAVGGFVGINVLIDPVAEMYLNYAMEGKISYQYGGRSSAGVIGGAADRFHTIFVEDAAKLLKDSQKFDTLDLARDVVRAVNSVSGFSDTLTDAIFNTARFAVDDYQLNNPDDLREYIAKTLFDRKLKKRD